MCIHTHTHIYVFSRPFEGGGKAVCRFERKQKIYIDIYTHVFVCVAMFDGGVFSSWLLNGEKVGAQPARKV